MGIGTRWPEYIDKVVLAADGSPLVESVVLDGVIFNFCTGSGKLDGSLGPTKKIPAIETADRVEYWQDGRLHNDGEPAIWEMWTGYVEFWEHGKFLWAGYSRVGGSFSARPGGTATD